MECDFYLQDFFFFVAVFHNINAPHWWEGLRGGGGGGGGLINISGTEQ